VTRLLKKLPVVEPFQEGGRNDTSFIGRRTLHLQLPPASARPRKWLGRHQPNKTVTMWGVKLSKRSCAGRSERWAQSWVGSLRVTSAQRPHDPGEERGEARRRKKTLSE